MIVWLPVVAKLKPVRTACQTKAELAADAAYVPTTRPSTSTWNPVFAMGAASGA